MKKKIVQRSLLGFPLGVFLGYAITIVISMTAGDGRYYPCVPELIDQVGSEIGAVILQTLLSGILGAAFAAASLIWENERLNIVKQTGLYFIVASLAMLPVAYFARWMEHSLSGLLIYIGVFAGIFVVVWIVQYSFWRKKIRQMNRKFG